MSIIKMWLANNRRQEFRSKLKYLSLINTICSVLCHHYNIYCIVNKDFQYYILCTHAAKTHQNHPNYFARNIYSSIINIFFSTGNRNRFWSMDV